MRHRFCPKRGFTLPELLVTIAIIAVIGAFTVPKVLGSQSEKGYNTGAKAFASQLQAAYGEYQQENQPTGTTTPWDVTPYMNYLKVDTMGQGDRPSATVFNCYSGYKCLRLHDGALVRFDTGGTSFGNTYSTNALYVYYDPDGKPNTGTGLQVWLYYDGNVLTKSTFRQNTCDSGACYTIGAWEADPTWFDWSK